ncbi:hypothetical protein R6Q59_034539 [Mikania micrantha]|uniref:Uncharacterized protein n=1 Tax=Mikania micrantha TaxID=192012 RepID=A0A5N6NHM8_9ASTR|nr:hypothetical protein E3N88_20517 [Mikania micrantha]
MEDRGLQTIGGPQSVGDGGSGTSKNRYVMEERRSATTDDRRSHNRVIYGQKAKEVVNDRTSEVYAYTTRKQIKIYKCSQTKIALQPDAMHLMPNGQ